MKQKKTKSIFIVLLIFLTLGLGWFIFNSSGSKKNNSIASKKINPTRKIASVDAPKKIQAPSETDSANEQQAVDEIITEEAEVIPSNLPEEIAESTTDIEHEYDEVVEEEEEEENNVDEVSNAEFTETATPEEQVPMEPLLPSPVSKSKEIYDFDYNARKYPVRLRWSPIEQADRYELEVSREGKVLRRYFKAMKNKFDIMIYPEKNYKWRVLAYKNNKVISEYSPRYDLKAQVENLNYVETENSETEPEEYSALDYGSDVDDLTDETEVLEPVDEVKMERKPASSSNSIGLWSRFWLWVGAGSNATGYKQDLGESASLSYDTIKTPSFSGATGLFISDKIAVEFNGGISLGELNERNGFFNESYTWSSYGLEALYLLGKATKDSKKSSWYLRGGGKYHNLPLLQVSQGTKDTALLSNNILAVSLGLGKRTVHSKKFRSDLGVSYQHPFSAVTNESDYSLNSSLFFNGHLNLYYQIIPNFNLGLYWQGQFFLMEYELSKELKSINGEQSLFNNKLGVFLGIDF